MNRKWLVALLMLVHFGITLYVSVGILGGIPHIPDSATYYRQGILLGEGKLFVGNFTRQPQAAFMLMASFVRDNKLFFDYPHFWPLLLALPIKLHVPWLLNPLLSAVCLLLVVLIATKLYDETVGIIAGMLYGISPLAVLMAADYMMHTATLFFLLLSFFLLLLYVQKQSRWLGFGAGLALGFAFAIRPLTAVSIALPFLAYLVWSFKKQSLNWKSVWFLAGCGVMGALFIVDNAIITGTPFKLAHPIQAAVFTASNLPMGFNYADSALAFLPPIIFYSFIPVVIFALAFIPLVVSRKKEDVLCAGMFFTVVLAYAFTHAMGLHGYGPRYYFEATFALFILAARGIQWVVSQCKERRRNILIAVFVLLVAYNAVGMARILPKYENYNFINATTFKSIESLDLKNSIVIIGHSYSWVEDGITASLYDPSYKNSFFIKELENGEHMKIVQEYPERKVYRIKGFKVKELKNNASNVSESV